MSRTAQVMVSKERKLQVYVMWLPLLLNTALLWPCYSPSTPLYMQDSFLWDADKDDKNDKDDDGGDDETLFNLLSDEPHI